MNVKNQRALRVGDMVDIVDGSYSFGTQADDRFANVHASSMLPVRATVLSTGHNIKQASGLHDTSLTACDIAVRIDNHKDIVGRRDGVYFVLSRLCKLVEPKCKPEKIITVFGKGYSEATLKLMIDQYTE